jgi:hypothetical protein
MLADIISFASMMELGIIVLIMEGALLVVIIIAFVLLRGEVRRLGAVVLDHEKLLFEAYTSRAVVLTAQVMLIHVGKQPPNHIGTATGPVAGSRFTRALASDPFYLNMIQTVLPSETKTPAKCSAFSAELDKMIDGRDDRVHPVNEIQIMAEAERLSQAITLWVAKGRVLDADEKKALDILMKCPEVLAAPRKPLAP